MGDEEKDLIQEKGPEAEQGEAVTEDSEPEQGQQEGVDSVPSNHIAEKRGRMVAAGLIATVILAAIAVIVAALFQFSSRWLIPCPWAPVVNDPAPILWKDVTSTRDKAAPLGVTGKLAREAGWKGPDTKE